MSDYSKHVLISGASTGIGAACALDLARRGFHVYAGVRKATDKQRLEAAGQGAITPISLDVTDAASIAAAVETVRAGIGQHGLWGLVNNAGIAVVGPLELVPIEEFRRQLEVNVVGHVAMIQAMLPQGRGATGRIGNIGSVNGFMAPAYCGPYAASKFALEALTDSLRVELRTWRIGVSIVEPGSTQTPIWQKSGDSSLELTTRVPPEKMALYSKELDCVRAAALKLAENAMPVGRVVWAVRHALTASRPRSRYPIGLEARLAWRLARLLPDAVRDWIVRNGLGLP